MRNIVGTSVYVLACFFIVGGILFWGRTYEEYYNKNRIEIEQSVKLVSKIDDLYLVSTDVWDYRNSRTLEYSDWTRVRRDKIEFTKNYQRTIADSIVNVLKGIKINEE